MMMASCVLAAAMSVIGFWTTIDDETNEPKSVVQIYEKDGVVCGKVVKTFHNPDAVAKIPGSPKIVGLEIIKDLKPGKDGRYEDGTVLDPENGKTYRAAIWTVDGHLKLRGYIGWFFRTQTWNPAKNPAAALGGCVVIGPDPLPPPAETEGVVAP